MGSRGRDAGLVLPALRALSDAAAIEAGFLSAYWLRFGSAIAPLFRQDLGVPSLGAYALTSACVVVLWYWVFRHFGLHGARRKVTYGGEFVRVARAVTAGMVVVTSLAFFYRGFSFSRAVWLLAWVDTVLFVWIGRALVLGLERRRLRRGVGLARVAVVGSGSWGRAVCRAIERDARSGLRVVGGIGTGPDRWGGLPFLGGFGECADLLREERIDTLLVALEDQEYGQLEPLMESCAGLNVEMYLVPSALQLASRNVGVEEIGGVPVVRLRNVRLRGWGMVLKRGVDVVVASLCAVLAWPALAVIAVAIRLESRGGVLYRQRRIGLDGKEFTIVKFRTMPANAERPTGPIWATSPDPRATRIGGFLRRFALDELPQLANVLRGNMSLVGPRPERPDFVGRFAGQIPAYVERHRVKCGMTGWAQIHGYRGDTSLAERIRYDIAYIESWSMMLDLRILVATPWVVLSGPARH